jgi:hypothetical protein
VRNTTLAGLLALAGGSAFAAALWSVSHAMPPGIALLLGGGGVPIVWVLATVLLWRETRPSAWRGCPACLGKPTVVCPVLRVQPFRFARGALPGMRREFYRSTS